MVEFARNGSQTGLDVPQTLPARQLREGHAQKLIEAGERAKWPAFWISFHASAKGRHWQKVHDLREHQTPDMHANPGQGAGSAPEGHSQLKSIRVSSMTFFGKFRGFHTDLRFLTGQQ
jgi:hypothetical protein